MAGLLAKSFGIVPVDCFIKCIFSIWMNQVPTLRPAILFKLASPFLRGKFIGSPRIWSNSNESIFQEKPNQCFFHARLLRVTQSDSLPDPWKELDLKQRLELKERVFGIIRDRRAMLFGCAIEKSYAELRHEDPYERAFEDLVSRFDLYLSRINNRAAEETREEQRGLLVLAQSSYEKTLSLLARRLQNLGTRWRSIHNITDIPLFAPRS